jgi:hypothetical protein
VWTRGVVGWRCDVTRMLCAAYSGEDGGALKEAEVLKKASDVGVEAPEADVFFLCLGRNFSLEGTPGRIVTEKSPAARSTHPRLSRSSLYPTFKTHHSTCLGTVAGQHLLSQASWYLPSVSSCLSPSSAGPNLPFMPGAGLGCQILSLLMFA